MLRYTFNVADRSVATVFRKKLKDFLVGDKDKITARVLSGAEISNNEGYRLWPNHSKDPEIGIRFDWGSTKRDTDGTRWRMFNLQVNKNANNPTLRELASGTKSHIKRVSFEVQVGEDGKPLMKEKEFWNQFMSFVNEASEDGI